MHICLFDIDGTLLNTGGAGQAAMEDAFGLEFGTNRAVEGLVTAGRTDRAIAIDLFKFHGFEFDDASSDRFYQAYLRRLPTHLAERAGLVLPGVESLLETLSQREDVVLGLLTGNFREGAKLKLGHFNLHHHFDFGGFGDRHLDRDDVAREALDAVRERFNGSFDAAKLWVIGDTPADVRCGRAIGAKVLAVATGQFSADHLRGTNPDYLFENFADGDAFHRVLG